MAEAAEDTANDLGEQTDDAGQDDAEEQDTDDMVSLDLGEGTEDDDESEESEASTDETDEKDKELTVEDYKKQLTDFEKKAEKREAHIKDLNKALHQERKKSKETKTEDETPLTPTQLRELLKEHHDDPDMMFNIMDYMAKQAAKGVKVEAINETQVATTKKDVDSTLLEQFPDLAKDDSELRQDVETIKERFFIDKSHPLSDFLSIAAMSLINLPKALENAKDEGKREALGEKAEATRKKNVKETKLTPKGKVTGKASKLAGLSPDQAATATQIGLTGNQLKIYARLLKKKSNRVEVQ
jgi:hypothetical protein